MALPSSPPCPPRENSSSCFYCSLHFLLLFLFLISSFCSPSLLRRFSFLLAAGGCWQLGTESCGRGPAWGLPAGELLLAGGTGARGGRRKTGAHSLLPCTYRACVPPASVPLPRGQGGYEAPACGAGSFLRLPCSGLGGKEEEEEKVRWQTCSQVRMGATSHPSQPRSTRAGKQRRRCCLLPVSHLHPTKRGVQRGSLRLRPLLQAVIVTNGPTEMEWRGLFCLSFTEIVLSPTDRS